MNPEPLVYNQRQPAQRTIIQNQQPRKIQPQPVAARPVSPSPSWHTPSAQNRPVSPPKTNDSFKIKLPTMGKMAGPGGAGGKVKVENVNLEDDDDIISIDASPVKIMRPSDPLSSLNRPGLQISRGKSNSDEGVDPLSLDNEPPRQMVKMEKANPSITPNSTKNPIVTPDFSSLIDDDISTTGDWMNVNKEKSRGDKPGIKVEVGSSSVAKAPVMEGSGKGKGASAREWCAVCHDGGDTLYCCDRCPNVYHMFCYIPPLTTEPPDDWICLMCATPQEIMALSSKVQKGRGRLSERDLKLCRRLLLEMYNMWPESVPFRDVADLNFPAYLDKIKEPIALDVIKERLDEENPDQYTGTRAFLADLRKMFRNCFTFNVKESEIYKHARKLEDKLDKLLETWAPEFVGDPLMDLPSSKGNKRPGSPSSQNKKGRKKKKRADSDDDDSDSEVVSEQERERREYLAALHASTKGGDNDPDDDDFDPMEESRSSRGKRGRPRKR